MGSQGYSWALFRLELISKQVASLGNPCPHSLICPAKTYLRQAQTGPLPGKSWCRNAFLALGRIGTFHV
jgi:hypothetical protein